MVVCLCEFLVKAKVLERLKNTIYLSGNLLSVCVKILYSVVLKSVVEIKRALSKSWLKRQFKKLVDQILSTFLTLR